VLNVSPQILNNTISGFSDSGIYVHGFASPTITGNQFSNNAAGLYIYYGSSTNPTVTNNTYASNSQGDLLINGSISLDKTWNEAAGTVYRVVAATAFNINNNSTLTISEGIIVKVNPDVLIGVYPNGFLDATGVTFTWADGVNEWRGIYFSNPDSRSRLVNCTIERAKGYHHVSSSLSDQAMIHMFTSTNYSATPLIQGCTIGNGSAARAINVLNVSPQILKNIISGFSNGYAVYAANSTTKPLVAGNHISGNNRGIGVFNSAAGLYRVNRIQGNTEFGIYNGNTGATQIVDARYNWWGSSTGPTIASNPLGTGDSITAKVDYFPWASSIADTDSDGMWDEWEVQQFTDLATASAVSDYDDDGLLDKDEFLYGTDPKAVDSDGDGVFDGLEVQVGMNPNLPGDYNIDSDNDTYSNLREQISGTDPYDAASIPPVLSDGDPLPVGDGDVDGRDLTGLISEFGRINCAPCKYDLDTDGDVDLADLFLFSEDFGRMTP
jgi:parallel beta-helix repeat protein